MSADNLTFEITGPDDDGYVWIVSPAGDPNIRGLNLGKYEDVAEKLCEWLAQNDYGEHDLPSNLKPIKTMPTR